MIDPTQLIFNDSPGILRDRCESDYALQEGLEVIPVLGPRSTPPVIVRLHSAYTERKVTFDYIRKQVPPVVPVPGDTLRKDRYLGGNLAIPAPSTDGFGNLVYRASGSYNFVQAADVRDNGLILFDSRSYRSKVDLLGLLNLNSDPNTDDTWNSPYFDLNLLGSARILG